MFLVENAFVDVRDPIKVIEPELRAAKVSVARLCRRAEVDTSTWVRWKQGQKARRSRWNDVLLALAAIAPQAAEKLPPLKGVAAPLPEGRLP